MGENHFLSRGKLALPNRIVLMYDRNGRRAVGPEGVCWRFGRNISAKTRAAEAFRFRSYTTLKAVPYETYQVSYCAPHLLNAGVSLFTTEFVWDLRFFHYRIRRLSNRDCWKNGTTSNAATPKVERLRISPNLRHPINVSADEIGGRE